MHWFFVPSIVFTALVPVVYGDATPPVVDLGYTLHQAKTQNTASGNSYFNFSNIRYAAPPIGQRRFAAPVWPGIDRTVQSVQREYICPQATTGWLATAFEAIRGQPLTDYHNFTTADIGPIDPRTSEDCLFLDVLTPGSVYHNRKNRSGAAVLVWIHGGGYVTGSKTLFGTGREFINLSEDNRDGGVIYVAINYRLGLFGWLSTGLDESGAVPNAGLLDQRLALEWIQKYIHLFGGDPKRVTLMGESAGGGSIMHQITAYGQGKVPFSKAIPQSPFIQYIPSAVQKNVYQKVLATANVDSLKALKNMSSSDLQTINALVVGNALPYGTFAFGPVVDGSFVPDVATVLLSKGRFDRSVNVMTGHNSDEGTLFTDPSITNGSAYDQWVRDQLPGISENAFSKIAIELYPHNFNGSSGYTSQFGRAALTMGDFSINCNAYTLNSAFGGGSFAYRFAVPPGLHGADTAYTFYDGSADSGLNATLATLMQRYFLNFAVSGSPNAHGLPMFPPYGGSTVQNLNNTLLGPIHDSTASARCSWWQQALYR